MHTYENTIKIQNFLPHRAPMLMVDLILELSDQKVKTVFEIKEDNLFVANNYFEEIGLIENAAQTCSAIVGQTFFLGDKSEIKEDVGIIGFISGIKKINIYKLPKVGEVIRTEAVLNSRFDSDNYCICTMKCETFVEEEILFETEINLFIQEK